MATTFHGFARLPEELKIEILRHHLKFNDPITKAMHLIHLDGRLRSTVLANKELNQIDSLVYNKENTFAIEITHISGPPKPWFSPHPGLRDRIHKLVLHINMATWQRDNDIWKLCPDGIFRKATSMSRTKEWQLTFTKLQSVKFVLDFDLGLAPDNVLEFFVGRISKDVDNLVSGVQGRNIEVEVKQLICVKHYHNYVGTSIDDNPWCDKTCQDTVAHMILGKLQALKE